MASLKHTKLSPTLFLLLGQDMNVMLKMLLLMGGHVELRSLSLLCDMLCVQQQLLRMGPFSLFSLIHSLAVQGRQVAVLQHEHSFCARSGCVRPNKTADLSVVTRTTSILEIIVPGYREPSKALCNLSFFSTRHRTSESPVSEQRSGGELIVLCITFLNF